MVFKNNKFHSYSALLLIALSFSGCGGGEISKNQDNNRDTLSNYKTQLSKYPTSIQEILNSKPVQAIDLNLYENVHSSFRNNNSTQFTMNLSYIDINPNKYYFYGVVKTGDIPVAENFFVVDYNGSTTTKSVVTRSIMNNLDKSKYSLHNYSVSNNGNTLQISRTNLSKITFTVQINENDKVNLIDLSLDDILKVGPHSLNLDINNINYIINKVAQYVFM